VPGDFETLRTVYGTRARYVPAFYPIPMDGRTLEPGASPGAEGRTVTLLVGNSGDPSNQHEWVFRSLARFRSEGVRILSPLSYGDPAYVASVIALGHELFGDQFTPLTEFLPPEQYARLIRDVDVAIMNHGYQQALGNIIAMLMLGKKVFVRSDTTTYRYFHDLGITVHDTLRIPESTLAELLEFAPETGTRNAESIRHQLSETSAVAGWRRLFDSVRGLA
jgi:dTDP-N-acetylfucosamine:lipid II N-acetylfucosaminyltransferase